MLPHGVMFHHFCDARHPPGQGAITASQLRDILRHLGHRRILSAHEWLSRSLSNTLPPNALCLTFDDNLRCQYDVALPVLEELGLTAFWFVYTSVLEGRLERLEIYRHFRTTCFPTVDDFYQGFFSALQASPQADEVHERLRAFNPDTYLAPFPFYTPGDRRFRFVRDEILGPQRYHHLMDRMIASAHVNTAAWARNLWMDAGCLRQLHARGHIIGLHSHTHPTRLEHLPPDAQAAEYQANFNALHRLLGQAPIAMSHPCNSYNPRTLRILDDLGIRLGFRANMAQPCVTSLEFPREDHANLTRALPHEHHRLHQQPAPSPLPHRFPGLHRRRALRRPRVQHRLSRPGPRLLPQIPRHAGLLPARP